MEQMHGALSNLEARFVSGSVAESQNPTRTAIFQFCNRDITNFHVELPNDYRLGFKAFYKYRTEFHPHPYELRLDYKTEPLNRVNGTHGQKFIHNISLYIELRRLNEFGHDDTKRYYDTMDYTAESNEEPNDFHEVYLVLFYEINQQQIRFDCNNGLPIYLPKLIPKPWPYLSTSTRFRYSAENRDVTFPCELKLRYDNIGVLNSYRIVICLITNTIPAKMDNHGLRWLCKFNSKAVTRKRLPKTTANKENIHCLSHSTGIVMAQVFGPDRKFTPDMLRPNNNGSYVRSYFEPTLFLNELRNPDNNESSLFAIEVTKETEYPTHMKNRRRNPIILQYLPFHEVENADAHLEESNKNIIERLKRHKKLNIKQLDLVKETQTYSQSHVRPYFAAYDNNNVLLAEGLGPPMRNNKIFEPLKIMNIVQGDKVIRGFGPAFVYCAFDYKRSTIDYQTCPYKFELFFTPSSSTLNETQRLQLFEKPHVCVDANYYPNCQQILQFQVPHQPEYGNQQIYIRLKHGASKDYNMSDIAPKDNEPWIYQACTLKMIDYLVEDHIAASDNACRDGAMDLGLGEESLITEPVTSQDLAYNSADDILFNEDSLLAEFLTSQHAVNSSTDDFPFEEYGLIAELLTSQNAVNNSTDDTLFDDVCQ